MNVKLKKDRMCSLVDAFLTGEYAVIGVKQKEDQYIFDRILDSASFTTAYRPTILPVKKFFLPQKETLFCYDKEKQFFETPESGPEQPVIFLGLRACDLESVKLLDDMLLAGEPDVYYQRRRRGSLLFVFDCVQPVDEYCFCSQLGKKDYSGADAVFYDRDADYIIEVRTERAQQVFDKIEGIFEPADITVESSRIQFEGAGSLLEKREVFLDDENIRRICAKEAENCFECGSCFMVCPTCICFTIYDKDGMNMRKGERMRAWDGCMLQDFSLVAGGHRLVASGADRAVHRFHRKYKNALGERGRFICVGCGRCSRACPAGNNIKIMLDELCAGGAHDSE